MPKPKNPMAVAAQPALETEKLKKIKVEKKKTEKADSGNLYSENKKNEIEEGLSEIYQGDDGKIVDVKKINIKKGRGLIFKTISYLLFVAAVISTVWGGYYYYQLKQAQKSSNISFAIEGEKDILAGKEFVYTVSYKNLENTDIKNIAIKLDYPENFTFIESSPQPSEENNSWKIDYLAQKRSGEIKIKGKLIGEIDQNKVIVGKMTYYPVNFSSEFSKETSFNNKISDIGIDFDFDYPDTVLIGDENEILIRYQAKPENYIKNFRLSVVPADNIEIINASGTAELPGIKQISQIDDKEGKINISFKFKDKVFEQQNINLIFEHSDDGQKYSAFYKKNLPVEVMKKNLNLSLIINGSNEDKAVNLGQALNYSITYSNKGETAMKGIVIMAALESDFLDWTTLKDKSRGRVREGKITWTKDEIPELANLAPNTEGTIDFAINIKNPEEVDPSKNYRIKSYARFTVGASSSSTLASEENKSNEIINLINSDISLKEQVRYFNEDNIAVGFGPLPPKVGETTSYKVYWILNNSLNELNNLQISAVLPANVAWDNKNQTNLGSIQYDSTSRKIIWQIGRLPITTTKAEAEFNIAVTPTANDKGKVMVLLPSTIISANDLTTGSKIEKITQPKTNIINDNQAVSDDGIVR